MKRLLCVRFVIYPGGEFALMHLEFENH